MKPKYQVPLKFGTPISPPNPLLYYSFYFDSETIIPSLFATICIMHHHGGRDATEGYKYILIEMVIQYHTTGLPSILPPPMQ